MILMQLVKTKIKTWQEPIMNPMFRTNRSRKMNFQTDIYLMSKMNSKKYQNGEKDY